MKKFIFACFIFLVYAIYAENSNFRKITQQKNIKFKERNSLKAKKLKYSNFEKKIWVLNGFNGYNYEGFSFCISSIKNNKIEGIFAINSRAFPKFLSNSQENPIVNTLEGNIEKNKAICNFDDLSGNKGTLIITFDSKDNNIIKAKIEFSSKKKSNKINVSNKDFILVPYSLKTIANMETLNNLIIDTSLNYWGNIRVVPVQMTSTNKEYPVLYLVNSNNDIFYCFDTSFQVGTRISKLKIYDTNNDGLKDIICITNFIEDESIEPIKRIFFQKENGLFYEN